MNMKPQATFELVWAQRDTSIGEQECWRLSSPSRNELLWLPGSLLQGVAPDGQWIMLEFVAHDDGLVARNPGWQLGVPVLAAGLDDELTLVVAAVDFFVIEQKAVYVGVDGARGGDLFARVVGQNSKRMGVDHLTGFGLSINLILHFLTVEHPDGHNPCRQTG